MQNDITLSLALFQPDIPQNLGAAIRLCACLGVQLHVIEPCGFPWKDQKIKKSAMDYKALIEIIRHDSWNEFCRNTLGQRKILMTTKTDQAYTNFEFRPDDILIAGQESSGVPKEIHESVDARITIPLKGTARSMNVINASSMILGEALRQIGCR